MNYEFLLSPQSFMNNTTSTSDATARAKSKNNDFFTASSESAKQKEESFESFMRDLQTRNSQNNSQSNAQEKSAARDANQNDAAAQNALTKENAAKAMFLTRMSKTAEQNDILKLTALDDTDKALSDIGAKMEQILAALEKAKQELVTNPKDDKADKAEGEGKITTETAETQAESQVLAEPQTIEILKTDGDKTNAEAVEILELFANLANQQAIEANAAQPGSAKETLTKIMDKLREMIESEKGLLITTNKTPAQLAEVQKMVQDILKDKLNEQDQKLLEDLAAQWSSLSLIPEQSKQTQDAALNTAQNTTSLGDEAAAIGADNNKSAEQSRNSTQARYDERYNADNNAQRPRDGSSSTPDDQANQSFDNNKASTSHGDKIANDNAGKQSAGERFLQNMTMPTPQAPIISAQGTLIYTDIDGAVLATAPGSSTQASMTNIATQAQHASQPHPATQTVMTTLTKAVKGGEPANIKVQLDPPELGRVEVKMSIDKDNITKVVLTSEKPETHMMLQRDAHILERVLQDTGLYNDGELSFELAQDFDQNSTSGEQSNSGYANGKADANTDEIIQTTMDWQIDPRTGVMHYNVLA